jgi:hypothetical protein
MINTMIDKKINKSSVCFIILLFALQFYTIKLGGLRLAIIFFILTALLNFNVRKIPIIAYIYFIIALISAIVNYDSSAGIQDLHYSLSFILITLLIQFSWLNLSVSITNIQLESKTIIRSCYWAIILCFISIAVKTPSSFFHAMNGDVGFFIEKGLAGYYLTFLSCILLFTDINKKINRFLFVAITLYVLLILQAGRSLFFISAVFLLFLERRILKINIITIVASIIIFIALLQTSFAQEQLNKLMLLSDENGGVGRYATFYIIKNLSIKDFLLGHGYGTYLAFRSSVVDLPDVGDFDYAGSFILEYIFEMGFIFTCILIFLIEKFIFKKITFYLTLSTILLLTFGGKQDTLMFGSLLSIQLMYQSLLYENSNRLSHE